MNSLNFRIPTKRMLDKFKKSMETTKSYKIAKISSDPHIRSDPRKHRKIEKNITSNYIVNHLQIEN